MKKIDLQGKSIFDFCNDQEVLDFISGNKPKQQYISVTDAETAFFHLEMLAFITDNEPLYQATYEAVPRFIDWNAEVFSFAEKYRKKQGYDIL